MTEHISETSTRAFPTRELRIFAFVASLTAHLALALLLALLVLDPAPAAIGGDSDEVRLATVSDRELDSSFAEVELSADVPDAMAQNQSDDLPSFDELTPVSDADVAAMGSGELATLGGAGEATGEGATGAGTGGVANFFGVEARGNRFAFVVDISGSMAFDGRLDLLKRELIESINALLEHTHFTVWAFSGRAYGVTGTRWNDASDAAKDRANRSVRAMRASGTTIPDPALEQVFSMRPRPDAIYFMTDGNFEGRGDDIIQRITEFNDRGYRAVPIHCITLVDRSGEAIMRRIAARTGGTYRHVPGARP